MNTKKMNQYKMEKITTSYQLKKYFTSIDVPVKHIDLYRMIKTPFSRAIFFSSDNSSLGYTARRICGDKYLQKDFLEKAGISVAKSKLFEANEKEEARAFAKNLPSAVVKPLFGNQAKGVSIGVEGDLEFDRAWDEAINVSRYKKVLVEENFQNGILARYLVVNGKCISVVEFTAPFVTGNGKDTIEELIEQKNQIRKLNPHLKGGLLVINDHTKKTIKNQGYDLSDIPQKGEEILLDHKANPNVGSDTIDITDDVHPLFKKVAEDATKAIPGLYIAGIDLLAHDHTIEPKKDNYNIIEMNNKAGLGAHAYPLYGYPRNVIKIIGNHLLKLIKIDNLNTHIKSIPYESHKTENNEGRKFDLNLLKIPNQYDQIIDSTNELLSKEFEKAGYQGYNIRDLFVVPIDDELMVFQGTRTSNFSFFANQIVDHQYWTREFLKEDNLAVTEGRIFKVSEEEAALEYARNLNMRVQLSYRDKGMVVSIEEDFYRAWTDLSRTYKKHKLKKGLKKKGLLVTKFNTADVKSRYLIIDGRCIGVVQYKTSPNRKIETINITPYVHPNFIKIAEKAARIVIGLDIVGVDIISTDHFSNPEKVGYGIEGLKLKPSIHEFHYPTYGEPQNIAKSIVDYSIHWAGRKKYYNELIGPIKEAELNPEKLLNHQTHKVRYLVKGDVKNVGFKEWTKRQALKLDLDGFCRYRWNNTLEVVASTKREENLIVFKKLLELGPRNAKVDKVLVKNRKRNVDSGFEII